MGESSLNTEQSGSNLVARSGGQQWIRFGWREMPAKQRSAIAAAMFSQPERP
jgi:hypothetical protein